jgi:hypothetical protein
MWIMEKLEELQEWCDGHDELGMLDMLGSCESFEIEV